MIAHKSPKDFWYTNDLGLPGHLKKVSLIPGLAHFDASKLDKVKRLVDWPEGAIRMAIVFDIFCLTYVDNRLFVWQRFFKFPFDIFSHIYNGYGLVGHSRVWRKTVRTKNNA